MTKERVPSQTKPRANESFSNDNSEESGDAFYQTDCHKDMD